MRSVVLVLIISLVGCEPAPTPSRTGLVCEPTLARMVPPQVVVDATIAGASPQPSVIPTREEFAARGNWLGNDAMWINLPVDGTMAVHRESAARAQHPAQPWGTKIWSFPLRGGQPKITARQLDGDRSGTFVGTASDGNIGTSANFSQPGCWELVYELAGQRLNFTVRIIPEG